MKAGQHPPPRSVKSDGSGPSPAPDNVQKREQLHYAFSSSGSKKNHVLNLNLIKNSNVFLKIQVVWSSYHSSWLLCSYVWLSLRNLLKNSNPLIVTNEQVFSICLIGHLSHIGTFCYEIFGCWFKAYQWLGKKRLKKIIQKIHVVTVINLLCSVLVPWCKTSE